MSRDREAGETIQWIVSSDERRELGRAAGLRPALILPILAPRKNIKKVKGFSALAALPLEAAPAFLASLALVKKR